MISILIVVGTCTRPCVAAKPRAAKRPCEPRPAACSGPRPAACSGPRGLPWATPRPCEPTAKLRVKPPAAKLRHVAALFRGEATYNLVFY